MIDTEELTPIIQRNAGTVRRFYPTSEKGDLEGVQWEWAYANPGHVKNYLQAAAQGLLANRLRTVAMRYARAEREVILGRNPEDLQAYNPRAVEELLKDVFDYENWQSSSMVGDGMPTSKRLANTTGDRIASLVDVKATLYKLPENQYNAIVWVFKYGYTYAKLADLLEISENAARKRVSRAVAKIADQLTGSLPSPDEEEEGSTPEYTGSRKVMSNAQARAITTNQWE